jgi:hypothetical protein
MSLNLFLRGGQRESSAGGIPPPPRCHHCAFAVSSTLLRRLLPIAVVSNRELVATVANYLKGQDVQRSAAGLSAYRQQFGTTHGDRLLPLLEQISFGLCGVHAGFLVSLPTTVTIRPYTYMAGDSMAVGDSDSRLAVVDSMAVIHRFPFVHRPATDFSMILNFDSSANLRLAVLSLTANPFLAVSILMMSE